MTLTGFFLLLLIAFICGAVSQALAGVRAADVW